MCAFAQVSGKELWDIFLNNILAKKYYVRIFFYNTFCSHQDPLRYFYVKLIFKIVKLFTKKAENWMLNKSNLRTFEEWLKLLNMKTVLLYNIFLKREKEPTMGNCKLMGLFT